MKNKSRENSLSDYLIIFILGIAAIIFIYPFIYVLSASFSSPADVAANPILLFPKNFTLMTYKILLSYSIVWQGYMNSVIYTLAGTTLNVIVTIMAAFSLSKTNLPGRKFILIFIIITMFINGGMIPRYIVVKDLGLVNTRWSVILPVLVSTWNLFIAKTYLQTNIPAELAEATEIDGGGNAVFFYKIVLPLSKPIITVLVLFYGASHWNAFFNALIYLRDRALYPLQLVLREILLQDLVQSDMLQNAEIDTNMAVLGIKYAIIVIAILPLVIVFLSAQKYFVKGVMIGSLKD